MGSMIPKKIIIIIIIIMIKVIIIVMIIIIIIITHYAEEWGDFKATREHLTAYSKASMRSTKIYPISEIQMSGHMKKDHGFPVCGSSNAHA